MKLQSDSNDAIEKLTRIIVLDLVHVVNDRFQSENYSLLRKGCTFVLLICNCTWVLCIYKSWD